MGKDLILGSDIGGSHITTALIRLSSGEIIKETQKRNPVDCNGTAQEIINTWGETIKQTFKDYPGNKKIGIAMPGPFDYENGISYIKGLNKYEVLYALNIKQLLAEKLDIEEDNIIFKNDAGCFLQGEIFAGAAREFNKAVGLTLGTGFGSAIGKDGVAVDAEFFSMPFLKGRAEDYFSTKWFVKRYHELSGELVSNVKELCDRVNYSSIAKKVFLEFSNNLATFLEEVIPSINPDIIIIGGNITHAKEYFLKELQVELLARQINIGVKISELGEDAALIGAASLWNKKR